MTYFEQRTRPDGDTFWCCTDDAPEWVRDAVHDAHEHWLLPDDWIYEVVANLFDYEPDDPVDDYVDGLVDIYTSDLYEWARPARWHLINEALDDYSDTIEDAIVVAQASEIRRIAAVINEARTDNQEDDE